MAFSFFFRDLPTLETSVKTMAANTIGRSKIRIWVAGSAMGQEVYTLAILLAEHMGYFTFQNVRIEATDIESEFGKIITQGIYPKAELERIPKEYFVKYFEPIDQSEHYQVVKMLRDRVTFTHHDLLSLRPISESLSLIVCKNVLLHFQPAERIEVFRMFHRSLAPDAVLANENTQKLPTEVSGLFRRISNESQVYQKVEL